MRKIISRILSGLISFILLEQHTSLGESCETSKSDGTLFCNCIQQRFEWFPQNLDQNCEVFDLSRSLIKYANGSTFAKYSKIKVLKLIQTSIFEMQDNMLFLPLTQVRFINMSGSAIDRISNMIWPDSLATLDVSEAKLDRFVSKDALQNLKILYMGNNKLIKFPDLDIRSPLELINLDYNIDIIIDAEDIIPFCKLQTFDANLMLSPSAGTPQLLCKCVRLKKWLDTNNIKNNLEKCEYEESKCNLTYDPIILMQNEACKAGKPIEIQGASPMIAAPNNPKPHFVVFAVVGLICFVLGIVATLAVIAVYNRKKPQPPPPPPSIEPVIEHQAYETEGEYEYEAEGEGEGEYEPQESEIYTMDEKEQMRVAPELRMPSQRSAPNEPMPAERPDILRNKIPRQKLPRVSQSKGAESRQTEQKSPIQPGVLAQETGQQIPSEQQMLPAQDHLIPQEQQIMPQDQLIPQEQMMPQEQIIPSDQQIMSQEQIMTDSQQMASEQVMPQGEQIVPEAQRMEEVPRTGPPHVMPQGGHKQVIVSIYKPVKDKHK